MNVPDGQVASVVVLVHGTFARGTKWPMIEVEARCQLAAPVRIEYFEWSGQNRVDARSEATRSLQEQLEEWYRRYPAATFYAIAHSHGGNVALRALSTNERAAQRVRALICLSTPFLDAAVRLPGASAGLLLLLSSLGWGTTLLLGSHWLSGSWAFATMLSLGVAAAYTAFAYRSGRRVPNLLAEIGLPRQVFPRVFVLRSPHDEAAIGLTLAQVVHVVLSLWRRFDALFDSSDASRETSTDLRRATSDEPLKPAAVIALVATAGIWLTVSWWYRDVVPSEWWDGWRFAILASAYLIIFVAIVFTTAFLFALVFFAVLGIPALLINAYLLLRVFGVRDAIAATLFVEVAVEPLPAGAFPCCQMPWSPDNPRLGLYHSLTYQEPSAVRQVGLWLKHAQRIEAPDLDLIGPF